MKELEKKLIEKWIIKKDLENRDAILSGTRSKKNQNASSCYEVMVHKLCQEKCLFCSQDHASRTTDIKPEDIDIYKRILLWYKDWYWMLGFTWWEPLIHPNILKYIKFAKKVGYKYIRIQTNGVMLGYPWFAKKCVEAGATLFKFSIHHHSNKIHDYLVWLPWALKKVKYGIKELKWLWARMWINIVLTEQNYRDLPDFLLHYLNLGISSFVIIFPLYENSMDDEADKVWFKFSDSIEYIIKSLHIFDKLWIKRPLVLNLPMCLLPWYENAIIQTFNWTAVLNLDWSKTNIDDNKAWWKKRVKICKWCEYSKVCFWVDEKYLAVFWEWEFQEKKEKFNYNFSLKDLKIKDYFTDNELCLLEILNIKSPSTIKEIVKIKDNIQICKDCEDMQKLAEVEISLLKKWYIKVEWEWMNKIYSKISFKK